MTTTTLLRGQSLPVPGGTVRVARVEGQHVTLEVTEAETGTEVPAEVRQAIGHLMDLAKLPIEQQKAYVRQWPELGWDGVIVARHVLAGTPPSGGDWRPIDSAPTDGTRILVWSEFRGEMAAHLDETHTHDMAYWTDHNGGGWVKQTWATPSHWMPLPSPPADSTDAAPRYRGGKVAP